MSEFVSWQQAQMEKFIEQQQAQTAHVLARMDTEVRTMEGRIIERVTEHFRDDLDKGDEQRGQRQEWHQLIQNLVQDSVVDVELQLEGFIERDLECGREELKYGLKEECLSELKDDLEGGLVSIVIPR